MIILVVSVHNHLLSFVRVRTTSAHGRLNEFLLALNGWELQLIMSVLEVRPVLVVLSGLVSA